MAVSGVKTGMDRDIAAAYNSLVGLSLAAKPRDVQNSEFEVHRLNEIGMLKAKVIAGIFDDCLNSLKAVCTAGPQFDQTRIHLEIACFHSKKSMAMVLPNQQ